MFDTLNALASEEAPTPAELTPAVPIKTSVTDDYIVCLEDGKKLKMLKRHLMTAYGMTPEEYRAKWGLKPDYPMVAPNYAAKRQELAKKIGLGRKPASRPGSQAAELPAQGEGGLTPGYDPGLRREHRRPRCRAAGWSRSRRSGNISTT